MAAKESDERAAKGAAGKKPAAAKPAKKPAAPKKAEKAPPKAKPLAPKPAAEKPAAPKPAPAKPAPAKPAAAKPMPAKPAAAKPAPVRPPAKPAPRAASVSDDDFDDEDEGGDEASIAALLHRPAPPAEPRPGGGEEEGEEEGEDGEPRAKKPKKVVQIPPMPTRRADGTITVAYSPDADDAFMYYALESGKVDTEGRKYETARADVQALNEEAKKGTYDVTALSFGAYPHVYERYVLLPCGASFGDAQGPILVSKTPVRPSEVNGLVVAVPGPTTTATLVLRLWLPRANLKLVAAPFDQIGAYVKSGKVRAGVLIHEGQLTWREEGLVRILDFGQWWTEKTEGLPLPLGANVIRRDIPAELRTKIALDIKRSIAYGLGHREEALAYAQKFARGMDKAKVDRYIQMYVNELTLDLGERGRQAAKMLLSEAYRHGFLARQVDLDFE